MDARVSAAGSWLALRVLFVGFLRVACRGRRGGQPLKASGQDAVAGPRLSLMTSVSRSNPTAGQPRTRPGSLRWRAPPRRCTPGAVRSFTPRPRPSNAAARRGSTSKPASRRRRSSRTKNFPTPPGASRTALPGEIPGRRDASSSADGERGTPESNLYKLRRLPTSEIRRRVTSSATECEKGSSARQIRPGVSPFVFLGPRNFRLVWVHPHIL